MENTRYISCEKKPDSHISIFAGFVPKSKHGIVRSCDRPPTLSFFSEGGGEFLWIQVNSKMVPQVLLLQHASHGVQLI
jgi:hypothetical protein